MLRFRVRSAGYNKHNIGSLVAIDNHNITINTRGINIIYWNNDRLINKNFDTFQHNLTKDIIKFHKELMTNNHFFIMLVHDEGSHKLDTELIGDYLEKYDIKLIRYLTIRRPYFAIYYNGLLSEKQGTYICESEFVYNIMPITFVCDNEYKYRCFEDYINSIGNELSITNIIGTNIDLNKYKYDKNTLYIHCQTYYSGSKYSMLLNTEQMTESTKYKYLCKLLNHNIGLQVIDYNNINIDIMSTYKYNKFHYIPYQYNEEEINKLKSYCNVDKKYDIGIVNCWTDRRKLILNKLIQNDINAINITGWNDDRDKLIGKCKILLNIHGHNDCNIWESIRCDRWIFAGLPVISESCINYDLIDIKDHIIWSKYEDIVDTVILELNSYSSNNTTNILNKFSNIIESRKHKLLQFKMNLGSL